MVGGHVYAPGKNFPPKLNKKYLLGLHSSSESFGVGVMDLSDSSQNIKNAVFETGRELSNKVFECIDNVLPFQDWKQICRLSVATGPGGFTGTRITIALSRTIAQQLKCELDGVSSFALMAKRIHSQNNLANSDKPFWIIQSLKRRGLIGGLYQIKGKSSIAYCDQVIEIQPPHLLEKQINLDHAIHYREDIKMDIIELLKFSNSANQMQKSSNWEEILPIYPTSPIDKV
tara:strand:- start:15 stop:704 length:690 start_codon:yes stop_codon:yes gene_type:complete